MYVTRKFTFDSAHYLTDYYGKCERVHGHTYTLEVTLEGQIQPNGLVIDFVVLKKVVQKYVLAVLDHTLLNEVLDNPSAERVAVWIWEQLKDLPKLLREEMNDPNLGEDIRKFFKEEDHDTPLDRKNFSEKLRLHEVRLYETPSSWVTYRGEAS